MSEPETSGMRAYVALMKPRVLILLQITALCAVLIHDALQWRISSEWDILRTGQVMFVVVVGGTLTAGGANSINMWYDRDIDPEMSRTDKRPVPLGIVSPNNALWFGISISILGVAWFLTMSNAVAAFWSGFSILFYVLIYTMWLKRTSTQNIVIGGIAGATPPLIGWAAAIPANELSISNPFFLGGDPLPWLMFALIFLWTPPHFWSLTLSKRKDYGEAGVPMLPVVKGEDVTRNHIFAYTLILLFLSILIFISGDVGIIFLASGIILSGYFVFLSFTLRYTKSEKEAWKLFKFSNAYLYTLFTILVLDAAYQINF